MSNNRAIHGKSVRSFSETYPRPFWPQNCHFLDRERSRKQVDVLVSTIIKQPHRFPNRLKTSLWGNMSENLWFPIHSTPLLPEAILAFSVSGFRSSMSGFAVSMSGFAVSMSGFSVSLKVPLLCNVRFCSGKNTAIVLVLPSPKT